jgi:LuxR family maltose regulon positive regulatory protein
MDMHAQPADEEAPREAGPLLATKLYVPPIPPALIARPRLIGQLGQHLLREQGFGRKVTLFSAPAGYGKTTLAVDWLRGLEIPFAWLSLDESDNDPARFLSYLVAALRQIDPGVGEALDRLRRSGQPVPPEALLTVLINDLAAVAFRFVLALDDYHAIQNAVVHQQVAFLIERQPPQMHLALLAREDPPLPLARLRARGELADIRQGDLRFTVEEAAAFLSSRAGAELAAEDVGALQHRIEGWAAGLQLAGLLLREQDDPRAFIQSFTGSSRYIMDYLVQEVLERQPAHVQEFLLHTAILDRFCAPLCDAVTARVNSRAVLEALEQASLFVIALDQAREWYRYHRLFADLLRQRLRLRHEPPVEVLHDRARQWFEAHGLIEEALQHALAAADWPQASRLIDLASGSMLMRGEIATLLGWFQRLPDEVIRSQPALCIEYAWPLLLAGQFDEADVLLEAAERGAGEDHALQENLLAARAYLTWHRGDIAQAVELSQQALAQSPDMNPILRSVLALNLGMAYWHGGYMSQAEAVLAEAAQAAAQIGNDYALWTARIFQGRTLAVQGRLRQAAQVFMEATRQAEHLMTVCIAYLDLGTLHCEWHDLETAAQHIERGIELARRSGNAEFQIAGCLALADLQLGRGDLEAAGETAQEAERLAQQHAVSPQLHARAAACRALAALARGDLPAAEQFVAQMREGADPHPLYRFLNLMPARLALARGEREQAAAHLAGCYEAASGAGWEYGAIAVRALQALAAPAAAEGLMYLSDALERAAPEGMIRTFVEAGAGLIPLLRLAVQQGIQPAHAGDILRAFRAAEEAAEPLLPADALSERELEVLRLLAAGLTTPEIADQLVVSVGTAKTHTHNIYSKLGVRNRTEAIARARELGLLR